MSMNINKRCATETFAWENVHKESPFDFSKLNYKHSRLSTGQLHNGELISELFDLNYTLN